MWVFQPEAASADSGTIAITETTNNFNVPCGEGSANYDSDTKTLTLENAVISQGSAASPLLYGITIEREGVTVELLGKNSIDAYTGIWSRNPFQILGNGGGSLSIRASRNQDVNSVACFGIKIESGGLTVQDADLKVTLDDLGNVNGYATVSYTHLTLPTTSRV